MSAMVWPVEVRDFGGRLAHVTLTLSEAGEVVVIGPAPGSFSLDAGQVDRFQDAVAEARAVARQMNGGGAS